MKLPKELAVLIGALLIMVFASLYLQHCNQPETKLKVTQPITQITSLSSDVDSVAYDDPYRIEPKASSQNFIPSIGINLESPQAEADMIGQSVPFVDVFRTARPFPEFSCKEVEYDAQGWPTVIPNSCGAEKARTVMLQSLPMGAVPFGKYTVLYSGRGHITYGGSAKLIESHPEQGYDVIHLDPELHQKTNRLVLTITQTDTAPNHLKDIRVVMPGGVCENDPFTFVMDNNSCNNNNFLSFSNLLGEDRNKIVFNPDYLRFLKDFRVLRTMNFMEASPRRPNRHFIPLCENLSEADYLDCVTQTIDWNHRAKMDDATWGGSFRTIVTKRFGVPLEVTVALANQLDADPWFNIMHNADDDYVQQYASYVRDNLNRNLKAHIEYSNETWNTGFWGAHYTQAMGYKNGFDKPIYAFRDADYSARVRYYSKRSVEIFKIWEQVFGGVERLVRIVGSNQTSTPTSKDILKYKNAYKHVDAVAIGPYFYGCWNREAEQCEDTSLIPEILSEASEVDDVFKIFNHDYNPNKEDFRQRGDPYGIESILNLIKRQVVIAKQFGVELYAYEGGQHLNVRWREGFEENGRADADLRESFEQANRDPRMKQLYLQLLNGWKEAGGKLFVMFTMPQTFHKWGSFGIKEHLNAPREESPKYDAVMTMQEQVKKPWY